MKGLIRSALLHACSGGGKCAVWQVVQHSLTIGNKRDIDEVVEFVEEYPTMWPDDFRRSILSLKTGDELSKKLMENQKLRERLLWHQSEEAKFTKRQLLEAEVRRQDTGLTDQEYQIQMQELRPEPRPN